MRKLTILTVMLIVLSGGNAVAQTELNGFIESHNNIRLNDPFDFMKLNSVLGLKINSVLDENVSAFVDLDLKYALGNKDISGYILPCPDTDTNSYFGVNIKEIYIDLFVGLFDIRLGKQIVSWGRVDALAPTDNINPVDYREFDILNFSNMKIAIPMLKVDAYLLDNYLHIEGIYIPYFSPSVYPDPESDWAFYRPEKMGVPLLIEYNYPKKALESSEIGLRVGSSIGGYDFSASYFYTWDDNPTITLTAEYHRLHIMGMDFAKAISDLGIRAESAFFITEDPEGEDDEIKDPYLKWALGCDYTFLNDYNINLQFSEEVQNLNFNSSSEVDTLSYIILNLSANFLDERLKIKLSGIYEIEDEDYLVIPQLEYDFSDSLNVSLGAQVFGGNEESLLGNYDENDAVFIKAKYSF